MDGERWVIVVVTAVGAAVGIILADVVVVAFVEWLLAGGCD